jgi:hypothetical protein
VDLGSVTYQCRPEQVEKADKFSFNTKKILYEIEKYNCESLSSQFLELINYLKMKSQKVSQCFQAEGDQ